MGKRKTSSNHTLFPGDPLVCTSPLPRLPRNLRKGHTDSCENGSFFGLVQCDVEVPAHLREYFSEMPPIFKNCAVSREDIGDFMKDYAKEHKLLSQPRQTLISSFSAQGILLTTPLLQWYLSHGLMVTNIQQTVEYKPQKCFQNFGEKVSNARRQETQTLPKPSWLIPSSFWGLVLMAKPLPTSQSTTM